MKNNNWIILIFIFFSISLWSQDTCICIDNLNKLIIKTEKNYAGFPAKVNEKTKKTYHQLIQSLKKNAADVTSPKACFYILKKYVQFFRDKHFILEYTNDQDYDIETMTYTEEDFKKMFGKKKKTGLEGIWTDADSTLMVGIKKFPGNIYKAIVLYSKDAKIPAGLVYMTLTPSKNGLKIKEYDSFYTIDTPGRQKGNLLQIWYYKMFGKVYPEKLTNEEKRELNTWKNGNNGMNFKLLSKETAYLRIPTFINSDDKIMELIRKNDSVIRSCTNLIIDLTGNGGGNTGWVNFLPYMMTNPIVQYPTYLRVTPENVNHKSADLEPYVTQPIPEEYKKYFPDTILEAYKKAFSELPSATTEFYPVPGVTFPLDSIMNNPKKIALIVDEMCGSSTEYFFFISKQSKKTKTYGVNTFGMMDFEGMSIPTQLPYAQYILTIPIVKSSWTDQNPIDDSGFKPDKVLDKLDRKLWIDYVQKDLEKNFENIYIK